VAAGEIKGFTGVDAPYEPPLNPEITLPNYKMSIQEYVRVLRGVAAVVERLVSQYSGYGLLCVHVCMRASFLSSSRCVDVFLHTLRSEGILEGAEVYPKGLPMPDGGEVIDLHVSPTKVSHG
jgi:hypothetical protein